MAVTTCSDQDKQAGYPAQLELLPRKFERVIATSATVTLIEYEIELERANGKIDHTSATLPPQLTKGQRLNVPIDDGWADAEVIEATQLTSDEPPKWKLIAREL